MRCRFSMTAFALTASLLFSSAPSFGESSSTYKVLSRDKTGFNVSAVEELLRRGDKSVSQGDLVKAKEDFDKARKVSMQLLSFYRDLSGSFRGLDARIPREMDAKGRETLKLLAQSNLRLAALFRSQKKPEVAVPLLIEVVKLVNPTQPEGQKAYQSLIELGFADTPYIGSR